MRNTTEKQQKVHKVRVSLSKISLKVTKQDSDARLDASIYQTRNMDENKLDKIVQIFERHYKLKDQQEY